MQTGSIGDWIRRNRVAKGWSQYRLARAARISASTLNRWERGLTHPSIPELQAVFDALEVPEAQRVEALGLLRARRAAQAIARISGSNAEADAVARPPLLGDMIRALRWRCGWTVAQLAWKLQVSERTVRAWERSENLPSDEHLHHLCFVLRASPDEAAFLLTRPLQITAPDADGVLCPEARFHEAHQHLQFRLWSGESEGMDLQFLTLTAQGWQLSRSHARGDFWLGCALILHCQWLLHMGRVKEAERRAYSAWRIVQPQPAHQRGSLWLVQAIARGTARNRDGQVVRPLVGAQVLQDWLPLARQWPEMEAWFLRGAAEFMAHAQRHEEATRFARAALDLAERLEIPVERHLARNAYAYVLVQAGRASEAIPYLSVFVHEHPANRVEDALLWHHTLLAVGDRQDAQHWLQRASDLVEQYHLDAFRARLQSAWQAL